jgi:hypothetical protein
MNYEVEFNWRKIKTLIARIAGLSANKMDSVLWTRSVARVCDDTNVEFVYTVKE